MTGRPKIETPIGDVGGMPGASPEQVAGVCEAAANPRVVHVSRSDGGGGAQIAAHRIHRALVDSGLPSSMTVDEAVKGDWTVAGPRGSFARLSAILRPRAGAVMAPAGKDNAPRSAALLPGNLRKRIARHSPDIVHLHWINGEMLSIAEIGRLDKPVVWTLHDMWPFCGAEHYAAGEGWKTGYLDGPRGERAVWRRKNRHWTRPINIVAPSRWLADRARESALMRDWPVTVIPNPLDLGRWRAVDRHLARMILGLAPDRKYLLFGAVGGTADARKGADLLFAALNRLALTDDGIEALIFGEERPKEPANAGLPVHYMGKLTDEVALRLAYSAADVFVLPSRLEAMGYTGMEAQACGRPVVAFDAGGPRDIVRHRETGYLATPFDTDDLAQGIAWCVEDPERWSKLSAASEAHVARNFAAPVVADQYRALYDEILKSEATR